MRILFLGPYKSPEFHARYGAPEDSCLGGQRKMALLLRALLQGGHEVKVVSSAIGWHDRWARQRVPVHAEVFAEGSVEVRNAPTVQLKPWGGLLVSLSAAWLGLKLAKVWKPDLVFSYNGLLAEAFGMLVGRHRQQLPFVVEVDDLPGVRGGRFQPKAISDRWLWPRVARHAAGFVFVNAQMRALIPTGSRPTYVLPGVVETALLCRAQRRLRPFSGRERRLLYAGGLSPERGTGDLLAAIPHLPAGWKAVVAGAGPLAGEFRALAEQTPASCEYVGLLSPLALYEELCAADVVLNTRERLNHAAGVFPFKLLEYLACGAHVISTPLPALGALDLQWFQRWSGSAAELPPLLLRAEADYHQETDRRERCARWVAENFSLETVSTALTELLTRARMLSASSTAQVTDTVSVTGPK